ncbi:ABC transporter substrate-binding protein [Streptomyces violaceoruber]
MRPIRAHIRASVITPTVIATALAAGLLLYPTDDQEGTTIKVGTTEPPTSLDPAGGYDSGSTTLYSNVFQTLLTLEPGVAEPVPDAAESCSFTDSGLRTYRCRLRDDITFSSGRRMTAKDVRFSFERVKKIVSDVGPSSLLDTIESMDARDRTVTFRLTAPDATFPFKLTTGAGSIVDSTTYPADSLRSDGRIDGTGPYGVVSYAKGEKISLSPNPRYKGAAENTGRPIELHFYDTPDSLARAWISHRIDVALRQLPPEMLADLNPSDPGLRVTEAQSAETRNLYLNNRRGKPFHDRRARQAAAWLIDRDRISYDVYDGTVDPLYSLIPTSITGHTTSFFDNYPHKDAEKARRLLVEAGEEIPLSFTYGYAAGRGSAHEEAAEVKKQLEADGLFKVTLRGYEWDEFQKSWAEGELDAYAVGWVADYPDPDTFGGPLVGTDGTMATGYGSKAADRLITSSQRFADRSDAEADLEALQRIVARDVPVVPLWQAKDFVVSGEDVGGGQYAVDGTGLLRLWRLTWI